MVLKQYVIKTCCFTFLLSQNKNLIPLFSLSLSYFKKNTLKQAENQLFMFQPKRFVKIYPNDVVDFVVIVVIFVLVCFFYH